VVGRGIDEREMDDVLKLRGDDAAVGIFISF
jgi:hypothetical protein